MAKLKTETRDLTSKTMISDEFIQKLRSLINQGQVQQALREAEVTFKHACISSCGRTPSTSKELQGQPVALKNGVDSIELNTFSRFRREFLRNLNIDFSAAGGAIKARYKGPALDGPDKEIRIAIRSLQRLAEKYPEKLLCQSKEIERIMRTVSRSLT